MVRLFGLLFFISSMTHANTGSGVFSDLEDRVAAVRAHVESQQIAVPDFFYGALRQVYVNSSAYSLENDSKTERESLMIDSVKILIYFLNNLKVGRSTKAHLLLASLLAAPIAKRAPQNYVELLERIRPTLEADDETYRHQKHEEFAAQAAKRGRQFKNPITYLSLPFSAAYGIAGIAVAVNDPTSMGYLLNDALTVFVGYLGLCTATVLGMAGLGYGIGNLVKNRTYNRLSAQFAKNAVSEFYAQAADQVKQRCSGVFEHPTFVADRRHRI